MTDTAAAHAATFGLRADSSSLLRRASVIGDLGRYQATRANVMGYATGRIPRMWDVWFA